MKRRDLLISGLVLTAAATHGSLAVASGGKEGAQKKVTPYVHVPLVTATIMRPNGRRGVLTVESGLYTTDAKLNDLVQRSLPRLRAAYFERIQAYAVGLTPGALPNADFVARELQLVTDRQLGRPGARFLLGSLIIN